MGVVNIVCETADAHLELIAGRCGVMFRPLYMAACVPTRVIAPATVNGDGEAAVRFAHGYESPRRGRSLPVR